MGNSAGFKGAALLWRREGKGKGQKKGEGEKIRRK